MLLKSTIFCCAATLVSIAAYQPALAQDAPNEAPLDVAAIVGRITKVIAYRGQALVTREVSVGEGRGPQEIPVSDLPANVTPDSLFADGSDGVEVRAVRFRTRVSGTESREEVQAVHEAIDELELRMRENEVLGGMIERQLAFLDKLDAFVAPTAMVETTKGILDAEQLKALSGFVFEKREQLVRNRFELEKSAIALHKDRDLLAMQLKKLGAAKTRLIREALIFVDKARDGAATVRLNYLVSGVNWRPTYNLRAVSGRDSVDIEYSALVTQSSGEDWNSVDLTLSTASPALIAQGAGLAPMLVSLIHSGGDAAALKYATSDANEWSKARAGLRQQQLEAARGEGAMAEGSKDDESLDGYREKNAKLSSSLNRIADELQQMEFGASRDVLKHVSDSSEGISVEYTIAGANSLQSRDDQQLVSIADFSMEASFTHVATPILSDYVYLQADAKNTSEIVLLEGAYSAYYDGRFVGRSGMPMVARGESFATGFGIDSQLRVSRELVNKDTTIRGGNRETTFSYRLLIQNFKDREVNIRLMDRIPYADRQDVRIQLKDMSTPLSEDKVYVRDQKPKGILRWDTKVAASAIDGNAKEITYSYTVEHDKQMVLTSS